MPVMEKTPTKQELLEEVKRLQKQLKITSKGVREKKYGLVWMDVPEDFEETPEKNIPVPEEIPAKSICGDGQKPTHLLFEGDNYHSLSLLNHTHYEKIDLIYIDPPYNTGSEGFRYQDKRVFDSFADGTEVPKNHPLRHSYWLSFMEKRLNLAYNLLKPDGAIFISINEEEYAQLKLLCDHIFKESNYLTTFTVKVRHSERILKGDKDYHETTELLLLYRKSPKFKTQKQVKDNTSIEKYVYAVEELTDNPETLQMGTKTVQVFKPGEYKITKSEPSKDKFQKINIRGSLKEGNSSGRFHMKYLEDRNHLYNYLYKVPDMGDDQFSYRYFLSRSSENKTNGFYFQGVPKNRTATKKVPYPNFLDFEEEFNTVGYEGGIDFRNGKKPVEFLKKVINMGTKSKDAIILDFFAGSGSTAHAVMEQNYIDNGSRQAILCTNNENNIAEQITYPRLRNVIKGYSLPKNQKEILFEMPLSAKTIVNNLDIIKAREKFFHADYQKRYDEIREEVRKNKYVISGLIKKTGKIKGFKDSLKYYKTSLLNPHTDDKQANDHQVKAIHKPGHLLAIAEATYDETEATDDFQIFANKQKTTAIYFSADNKSLTAFAEKLQQRNQPVTAWFYANEIKKDFIDNHRQAKNIEIKPIPESIGKIYDSLPDRQ
ncbi:MAG: site-specific DNA-methyltransferase [Bacteroidales bacterium]|nr:site-specific DNA-methyltransferase [Bacteroidales bacterium]MCF8328507.1 site-specific DNA-methyltransferase [Bacteroidales bacterium]